jgi:hypothetical protein
MGDPQDLDALGRPHADRPLADALDALRAANPGALGHVEPGLILIVAGAARREARASIRPLTFGGAPPLLVRDGWEKPRILRGGLALRYELCLRPRFFLRASPLERLTVLAHELWHASSSFDGALDPSRRHGALSEDELQAEVAELVAPWRDGAVPLPPILRHRGELRLSAWASRPPTQLVARQPGRRVYDERDLFPAIVEQT